MLQRSAGYPLSGRAGDVVIEAWGGVECTFNRVGDRYRDQLLETGHARRAGDFELLASLNLDAIRIPVLWEKAAEGGGWAWSDGALASAAAHSIRPIVGLVHHGSGPLGTSLVHEGFAPGLAQHAANVAERYPEVRDWTPVNEPLTISRFSALYGLWFPHARDEKLFWLALLNQVDATRLAMRAIRSVRPDARLIQTEDLGRTYATSALREQAAFDNERRWMTWDLLCGRVVLGHPLWTRLFSHGYEARLRTIADDPCPPAIIGINHYLTSDRLLDHRFDRYPEERLGGNGFAKFADVEVVRALDPPPRGLARAINEAWERYGIPIAITEIHNACTREEQIRWLNEAWVAARQARARGVDLQAVTAWALFGSQGWNELLTAEGCYESGAFDISGRTVRETALADAIRRRGPDPGGTSWWRRPTRFAHPPVRRPAPIAEHRVEARDSPEPLLILGASGTLGNALARECRERDIAYVLVDRQQLDLRDVASIDRTLDHYKPWAVVNAAGWVRVDEAEVAEAECRAANATGATAVARACAANGLPSLSFSTDLVFDGRAREPYDEEGSPGPLNAYGRSKLEMEEQLAGLPGNHLVIRTAAFFSPHDRFNFASQSMAAVANGQTVAAVDDCVVSPTYVPHLSRAALDLLYDRECGIWHLTNGEPVTWFAFGQRLVSAVQGDSEQILPCSHEKAGWRATRPEYSALTSIRGRLMSSLESAIASFANHWRSETSRVGLTPASAPLSNRH